MRQSDYRHGSPYDRGSADRYYGRPANPHFYTGDTYSSERFNIHTMTQEEIDEYHRGYNEEEGQKNWGSEEAEEEVEDEHISS